MNHFTSILHFVKELEHLKSVTRTAWTSSGRRESTAEHSWRLSVFAGLLCGMDSELDPETVLMTALIHDLGEIYTGDISAALLPDPAEKYEEEKQAVQRLFSLLEEPARTKLYALWQEYESGSTKEARFVRALDKAETIIQHNQGKNPGDFDYAFNLEYGKSYFEGQPLLERLREQLDDDTRERMALQNEEVQKRENSMQDSDGDTDPEVTLEDSIFSGIKREEAL